MTEPHSTRSGLAGICFFGLGVILVFADRIGGAGTAVAVGGWLLTTERLSLRPRGIRNVIGEIGMVIGATIFVFNLGIVILQTS